MHHGYQTLSAPVDHVITTVEYPRRMGLIRDARRAASLVRRAIVGRSAARTTRQISAHRPRHPSQHFQIAVYFADGAVNMYQIRQWYRPLAALVSRWPVVVLSRSATGARQLLDDDALPVAYVPTVRDLELFLADQDIRLVFYVNQNTKNFQMFRYGRRWHVFINHGESDKMYMATNQYKAYDYAFIAGAAARKRLRSVLWDVDLDAKTFQIGRPQADHFGATAPYPSDGRTVVLYAPTWEGDRPSAHYGSVRTHGVNLVPALLASPNYRVIYRPHPRSGVVNAEYGAANQAIIGAIADANAADSSAHHVYDDGAEVGWQLAAADVAVLDISAMVYDRLAVGKPLLVTRPLAPEATVDTNGYLGVCEWLDADASGDIMAEVERVRHDDAAIERLRFWAEHYFGDTTVGAASRRFEAAVEVLMQRWIQWDARPSTPMDTGALETIHDDDL